MIAITQASKQFSLAALNNDQQGEGVAQLARVAGSFFVCEFFLLICGS